ISHFFYFTPPTTSQIYTLSLHDALPISKARSAGVPVFLDPKVHQAEHYRPISLITPNQREAELLTDTSIDSERALEEAGRKLLRSEEHTSELQSRSDLVCRLLLEKKKKK